MRSEESIFQEALRQPSPHERQAFIHRACNGNELLRREIEALLRAHERAADFLESPPAGLSAVNLDLPAHADEQAGLVVGNYKLLEEIGEGGMGVVFMAEQLRPVQRRVAVKIIKPGLDTRQVIARFEAERQALALMEHPNIARVFDAGTATAGRPYFVMELVRGIPITDYCDQNTLTPRQRLELFVQVCQAVQHAHQKGIIHRDLKPSNVLVTLADDGSPVPKVIDFGISKAIGGQRLTERTMFTEFRQLIGTPLYMSPEQAEMSSIQDVDTRSDVYSLGVLLYELLTGTTPFDKERLAQAACDEVRRIIREEEPPRPSTRLSTLGETLTSVSAQRRTDPRRLSQTIRGELDWIVMKALEKERGRRYETANGMAGDVQRYLADQPVEACPPSRAYRLRKTIRRNKAAIATAGALAGMLVAATAVSTWQASRAKRAQAAAVTAQTEMGRQRDQAIVEKRRADVQAATAAGFSDFYRNLDIGFDPSGEAILRKQAEWCLQDLSTRRELAWSIFGQLMDVYRGRKQADKVAYWRERLRDVLEMEVEAMSRDLQIIAPDDSRRNDVLSRRASAYRMLGRFGEASADLSSLTQSDAPLLFQRGMLHLYLGDMESYHRTSDQMLRRYGDSTELAAAIAAVQLAAMGKSPKQRLETLSRISDRLLARSRNSAAALLARGVIDYRSGNNQKAVGALTACRRKLRRLRGNADDGNPNSLAVDVSAAFFMAMAEKGLRHHAQAEGALREARRATASSLPEVTALSGAVGSGPWLMARQAGREADQILGSTEEPPTQPAPVPATPAPPPQLLAAANSVLALAKSLQVEQRYAEAEQRFVMALALQRQALGEASPDVAATLVSLARVLRDQKNEDRLSKAEKLLNEAKAILQSSGDEEELSAVYHELGYVYHRQPDRESDAENAFRESLSLQRRAFGSVLTNDILSLADLLRGREKWAESEPLYREALGIQTQGASSSAAVAATRVSLASVLFGEGRYEEAESLLFDEKSHLRIADRLDAGTESRLIELVIRLSRVLHKPEQAAAWDTKRLPILQAQIATASDLIKVAPGAAVHYFDRGTLYARTGDFAHALADLRAIAFAGSSLRHDL